MSDLTVIWLQGFQWAEPDVHLTELIYYEYCVPILQLKFTKLHLSHPPSNWIRPKVRALLWTILTTHLQWLGSMLTAQHYTSLANEFLERLQWST